MVHKFSYEGEREKGLLLSSRLKSWREFAKCLFVDDTE